MEVSFQATSMQTHETVSSLWNVVTALLATADGYSILRSIRHSSRERASTKSAGEIRKRRG